MECLYRIMKHVDREIDRLELLGFIAGLAVVAVSMSSGFIWAYQGQLIPVYIAGAASWTGYIAAHYAVTGVFVDGDFKDELKIENEPEKESEGNGDIRYISAITSQLRDATPNERHDLIGFIFGITVLITGIALLAYYVSIQNHGAATIGSSLFLAGYVIAHYYEIGVLL